MENYLVRRDVELEILEEREYWDVKVENEAIDSWIELMLKVKPMKSGEAKDFWLTNLNTIHTMFRRHQKIQHDFKKLEVEYNKLYNMYQELSETVNKLKEEF